LALLCEARVFYYPAGVCYEERAPTRPDAELGGTREGGLRVLERKDLAMVP
jgi:hypothetical protein